MQKPITIRPIGSCEICKDANHDLLHMWICKHPYTRQPGFQEQHAKILRNLGRSECDAASEIIATSIGVYEKCPSVCDFCNEWRFGVNPQKVQLSKRLEVYSHFDCQPCVLCNQSIPGVPVKRLFRSSSDETDDFVFAHGRCEDAVRAADDTCRKPVLSAVLKLLECKRKGNFRLAGLEMAFWTMEASEDENNNNTINTSSNGEEEGDMSKDNSEHDGEYDNRPEYVVEHDDENEGEEDAEPSEAENEGAGDTEPNKSENDDGHDSKQKPKREFSIESALRSLVKEAHKVTKSVLRDMIETKIHHPEDLKTCQTSKSNFDDEKNSKTTTMDNEIWQKIDEMRHRLPCDFCNDTRIWQSICYAEFYSIPVITHSDCFPCGVCFTAIAGRSLVRSAYGYAHKDCLDKCITDMQQDEGYCHHVACWQHMPCLEHPSKDEHGICSVQ